MLFEYAQVESRDAVSAFSTTPARYTIVRKLDDTLTHDMARNLLVSAEHYYRDSALCGLLDNWNGLAVGGLRRITSSSR